MPKLADKEETYGRTSVVDSFTHSNTLDSRTLQRKTVLNSQHGR